jgi:hypothetical protein
MLLYPRQQEVLAVLAVLVQLEHYKSLVLVVAAANLALLVVPLF